MIFELSSQVLRVRPVRDGEDQSPGPDDYQNLELAVMKIFERNEKEHRLHLEVDDNEFGVYQLHIEIDTDQTDPQWAVDQLQYGVEQLSTFVASRDFILTEA